MCLQQIEARALRKSRHVIEIADTPLRILPTQQRIKALVATRGVAASPLEGSIETHEAAAPQ